MNETTDPNERLKAVLKILNYQKRMLAEAASDPLVVDDLGSVINYLSSINHMQASFILSQNIDFIESQRQRKAEELARISNLKLHQVKDILQNARLSRKDLESIAIGRFDVPKGSLKSLGSISQLRKKLETLIINEESHERIEKVIRDN